MLFVVGGIHSLWHFGRYVDSFFELRALLLGLTLVFLVQFLGACGTSVCVCVALCFTFLSSLQ